MDATIFQAISDWIVAWFPIITSFVGTFALIATKTPNTSDDKIVDFLLKVTNFLGANIGAAANKDD